jgi:hypothetical protein
LAEDLGLVFLLGHLTLEQIGQVRVLRGEVLGSRADQHGVL